MIRGCRRRISAIGRFPRRETCGGCPIQRGNVERVSNVAEMTVIATATFGLEAPVAREVKKLGYENTHTENGRITFNAGPEAIPRANLWLRQADRVLVQMGRFPATTFEQLFESTRALPWADWLPENANFPVSGKSVQSGLFSVPDCQAIVKKAVVESLKTRYHRQWFDEDGPRFAIEVSLLKDEATITLDTTGPGLHKRGYRTLTGPAPLKETLAAALIDLSYWNHERPLFDPFCGSGTIPIEAAMMGLNLAPGRKRDFAAEAWPAFPAKLWRQARAEADDLAKTDRTLRIRGTDHDERVLSLARVHARQAGVEEQIHFQCLSFEELKSKEKYACMIANPPYGERLEDRATVETLYRQMGKMAKEHETWSYYILATHPAFETLFGRKADRRRKLYNGRIECQYYQYAGPRPPRRDADPAEAESGERR